MKRVIVLLACGGALSACTSTDFSMPSMPSMSFGGASASTVNVRVESQPQGAEAKSSAGAACRTPCTLALPANGTSTVSFSLQGYLPTSVPVAIRTVRESWDNAEAGTVGEQVTIDPNPVFAALDPAPPPPPPKRTAPRKPAQPRAQTQQPPQQQQQPAQAPGFGPAPPPPGFR